MKLLACVLLMGMVGCSKAPKIDVSDCPVPDGLREFNLVRVCESRHLYCTVERVIDNGHWIASASTETAGWDDQDRWYGNGKSEEEAETVLVHALEGNPTMPHRTGPYFDHKRLLHDPDAMYLHECPASGPACKFPEVHP